MQKQVNKQSKLAFLKSILNGNFNVESLQPPQYFTVCHLEDGLYDVAGKQMNEDEYNDWQQTCRESDRIFFIEIKDYRNEPIDEDAEPYFKAPIIDNHTTIPKQIEAVESPVIDCYEKQQSKKKESEQETELFAIPVKRSGKLSELGDTWFLTGMN